MLEDTYYIYLQHDRLKKIVQEGKTIIQDGEPTIIIAHSFGGILAKAIISHSPKANIKKLITMASPHRLNYLKIDEAKKVISSPFRVNVPTETFGGYFDPIVPFPFSYIDKQNHSNFPVEHMAFLFSRAERKEIIETIKNHSINI